LANTCRSCWDGLTWFANELEIEDGRDRAESPGEIVDGKKKADLLQALAEKENISLDQVVAVGDGANDLPMLNVAAWYSVFTPKPLVRSSASHAVSYLGLDSCSI